MEHDSHLPQSNDHAASPWYKCPETWFFVAVALLGALLRIEYLREFAKEPHFTFALGADISEYYERAQEILSGKLFPAAPEIHGPLYSFFLALLCKLSGSSIPVIRACQLMLNFAAWIAFYLLLKKRGASFGIRSTFLLFAMLLPAPVFHQAELVSESILLPLLALFFWVQYWSETRKLPGGFALSGAVGALLVLTHGLMLCFAGAFILWQLYRRKYRQMLHFCAAFLLLTGIVIAAKSAEYGKLTGIQGNSFFNLYLGNNPDATGGCYMRPDRSWKNFHTQAAEEMKERNIGDARLYLGRIGDFYIHHPGKALLLAGKKVLRVFAPWEYIAGSDPNALIMATAVQRFGRVIAVLVLLFALWGIYRAIREKLWEYNDFYLLAGALALGQIITVTAGRYRQGMMPGIILLAALGAAKFPWKKYCHTLPLLGAALLLTAIFPLDGNNAEAAGIRAEALMKLGRYQEAKPLALFAEKHIDHPACYSNMLGDIAEIEGDWQRAWQYYTYAAAAEPNEAVCHFKAGHLAFRMGNYPMAEPYLRRTLELDQQQPVAWNDLGFIAFQTRNWQIALNCFENAVTLAPGNQGYQRNLAVVRQILSRRKLKAPK